MLSNWIEGEEHRNNTYYYPITYYLNEIEFNHEGIYSIRKEITTNNPNSLNPLPISIPLIKLIGGKENSGIMTVNNCIELKEQKGDEWIFILEDNMEKKFRFIHEIQTHLGYGLRTD
jgi:hypothetical protein